MILLRNEKYQVFSIFVFFVSKDGLKILDKNCTLKKNL
jgi:hypothetical protein